MQVALYCAQHQNKRRILCDQLRSIAVVLIKGRGLDTPGDNSKRAVWIMGQDTGNGRLDFLPLWSYGRLGVLPIPAPTKD